MAGEAGDAYLAAAEHALSVYAIDEAEAFAKKAHQGDCDDAGRFRALRVLEFAAERKALRVEQVRYLDEMRALGERLGSAEFAHALARDVDFSSGESTEYQRSAIERLGRFVESAPAYAAAYELRMGEFLSRAGEVHEAKTTLQKALGMLTRDGDLEGTLRCLAALYAVSLTAGEPLEQITADVESARVQLGGSVDARIRARLAFIECGALLDRDPAAAQQSGETMLQCAKDAGDIWLEALAHRSIGAAATRRMLISLAQSHLRRSAEITTLTGRLRDLSKVRNWQLMCENRCADFDKAVEYGMEGLAAARACDARDMAASIQANLANTMVWSGDLERADSFLAGALATLEQQRIATSSALSLAGEIRVGQGKLGAGIALMEQAAGMPSPQYDALGAGAVHKPLILGLAYAAANRIDEAQRCAQAIRLRRTQFESYYIHPQVYLWSAGQLLRMLGYDAESREFTKAAVRRRNEIRLNIADQRSLDAFERFIFNRLIEEAVDVSDPLHAWFTPYAARFDLTTA